MCDKLNRMIVITLDFPAYHRWPKAPYEVKFLRETHRHLFKVDMGFDVTHNDRDLEFFTMKRTVIDYINKNWYETNLGCLSCEMMAEKLLLIFNATYVKVFEDGENGAFIYRSKN